MEIESYKIAKEHLESMWSYVVKDPVKRSACVDKWCRSLFIEEIIYVMGNVDDLYVGHDFAELDDDTRPEDSYDN